ncbi:hypothetical protein HPP92_028990 [Vanilla planifolia]|uniref:Uncharacterized protein n=1 Tax=Vanilla planifolia TaxID=51239 RepID=A0A835P3E4_VANPL|nr:hypothetical protein HPP92_028990 [Vanilla planifolia]KAG0446137.1 hypothetical protein HPP92_028979 [Vanilla planifolia]
MGEGIGKTSGLGYLGVVIEAFVRLHERGVNISSKRTSFYLFMVLKQECKQCYFEKEFENNLYLNLRFTNIIIQHYDCVWADNYGNIKYQSTEENAGECKFSMRGISTMDSTSVKIITRRSDLVYCCYGKNDSLGIPTPQESPQPGVIELWKTKRWMRMSKVERIHFVGAAAYCSSYVGKLVEANSLLVGTRVRVGVDRWNKRLESVSHIESGIPLTLFGMCIASHVRHPSSQPSLKRWVLRTHFLEQSFEKEIFKEDVFLDLRKEASKLRGSGKSLYNKVNKMKKKGGPASRRLGDYVEVGFAGCSVRSELYILSFGTGDVIARDYIETESNYVTPSFLGKICKIVLS